MVGESGGIMRYIARLDDLRLVRCDPTVQFESIYVATFDFCISAQRWPQGAAFARDSSLDSALLRWHEQVDKCVRPVDLDSIAPPARNAVVHVAMFEAVNAVMGKCQPYAARIVAVHGGARRNCKGLL